MTGYPFDGAPVKYSDGDWQREAAALRGVVDDLRKEGDQLRAELNSAQEFIRLLEAEIRTLKAENAGLEGACDAFKMQRDWLQGMFNSAFKAPPATDVPSS